MATTRDSRRVRVLFAVTAAVLVMLAGGTAQAQAPRPGDTQILTAISLSLRVGSTEQESRKVTYTPPPGWIIRSHAVLCTNRYGNSSYAISTVPASWVWSSEEQVNESYKQRLDLAAKVHDFGAQARLKHERDAALGQMWQASSSHNALVLDASAKGGGIFRSSAAVELTVMAELVYVGTGETLNKSTPRQVGHHK